MSKTLNPTAGKSLVRVQQTALYNGAGTTVTVLLQRQNLYRQLALRLSGQITCLAASNTAAAAAKGDEWGCITRFRLVVNGTDALVDLTGDDLWMINKLVYGVNPRITTTLGDGTTANPSFDSTLIVPLWSLRCRKPMETAYESWRAGSLQAEITFGSYTTVSSGATAWTANPSVDVITSELTPAFNADGSLKFVPPFVPRLVRQYTDFATAQTAGKVYLDGAPFHRGILLNVQASGGGADLSTALSTVKLYAGSTMLRQFSAASLQQYGEVSMSMPTGIEIDSTGIARKTRCRISTSSDPAAWYYLHLLEDGYLSEAIGGMNAQDVYLEVSTSAACRIVTLCQQVLPNPAAA